MRILHLFGSTRDRFYFDLSRMYAEAALRPAGTEHVFAAVAPDGRWQVGPAPDALGPPMPLSEALGRLPAADLVVPHMFCRAGMTSYRALVEDILGMPLVGAPAHVAGLAASKSWTRDVVTAAGVSVAPGERLGPGARPVLAPPFVVKPDSEDNSLGVSVVREESEIDAALAHARRHDDVILAEAFVPGRELRVAVVELDGALVVPAFIEYPVSEARPIREVADKLEQAEQGGLRQSRRDDAQPVCPAEVAPELAETLRDEAIRAHRALGARHYSLFDFRVHSDTGAPYLLEAGLFWSFSSLSAITKMLAGAGHDPADVTRRVWQAAIRDAKSARAAAA